METVENYIRREYIDNENTIGAISKNLGVGPVYVRNRLRSMNIDTRSYNGWDIDIFINRANDKHGPKYDYSKFIYITLSYIIFNLSFQQY